MTYEIRISDGMIGHTSIFKDTDEETAISDAEGLHAQMERMGVEAGHIQVLDERNMCIMLFHFTRAADRARRSRQKAQHAALVARWNS